MLKLGILAVVLAAITASGCAVTRTARLYDMATPNVMTAQYRSSGTGRGPIFTGTREQPVCSGEYVTVAGGDTTWGAIFSGGTVAQALAVSTANDQRGSAVLTCPDGVVITCEYVTSATSNSGHGACRDNREKQYRLMF